ncbi:MAG TPA: pilin [Candidatus Saccharimonadales bacterium]|nr:pilin [Candidatus Saccharimonadales bacterium]
MTQKIKSYFLPLIMMLSLLAPGLVPLTLGVANAEGCTSNIANNVADGASQASGQPGSVTCDSTNVDSSSIGKIAQNIVKIFSIIVGAVSVIMIIYGGFRYITSGGDSGRVGSAKNTLIYAIIGLIIVALAQLIVHFVLNQSNNVQNGTIGG